MSIQLMSQRDDSGALGSFGETDGWDVDGNVPGLAALDELRGFPGGAPIRSMRPPSIRNVTDPGGLRPRARQFEAAAR